MSQQPPTLTEQIKRGVDALTSLVQGRSQADDGERVEKRETVIIGGGQSGLAMSYLLT
jgi:hypothetical protein